MEKSKTICLCLIVKNEEKALPRLIKSCRSIIDYWVIYDTGSNDSTMDVIARELDGIQGELHKSPFINYGKNRTELVQKAYKKADYLLLMDADMTIRLGKNFKKERLISDMYQIRYDGPMDYAQPLLVTGHIKWHYEGYTHEYLTSKEKFNQSSLSEMTIKHHGDGTNRPEKNTRDIKLLKDEIEDYPDRPRAYFYLAQTYQNMGEYELSIDAYKKRIQLGGWSEEIYYSLYQIGMNLYLMKNYDSAILQFAEAYDQRPSRFEALFMTGQIYRERKRYSVAKIYLDKAKSIPYPKNDLLFIHKAQYDYMIDFELGICNYWLGNYKQAEKHSRRLLNRPEIDQKVHTQNIENYKFIKDKIHLEKQKRNDIVFLSMYTTGTPYEQEVKILQTSFDKYNLFYEVCGIRPQGSWVKNTQKKAEIVKEMMIKHNKDVVWIDADAEVLDDPVWLYIVNCDISFHTIKSHGEILTGTVYFRNNDKIIDLLTRWITLNNSNNKPDAVNFQKLMTGNTDLKVIDMPGSYVRIFDSPEMDGVKPIIVHNQASRRFKDIVNTGLSPNNITISLLKNMINGYDSCSVIGNGPFKTNLEAEINSSFVFRCNDFNVGPAYREIGSRIDVNLSSLYHEIIPHGQVKYPIFGVLPLSDTLYQEYTVAKRMHFSWRENSIKAINNGNTVWTYNDEDDYAKLFTEIAKKINAFPTVGLMGIATARILNFKRIILSGFTFFQTERSHYWKKSRIRPSMHHNTNAERELVLHWVENDDIEYVLDEMLKENLYHNEVAGHITVK